MQEIAGAIREGAQAYLNRQYTTIAIVGVVVFIVAWLLLSSAAVRFPDRRGPVGSRRATSACSFPCAPMCAPRRPLRTALAAGLEIAFKSGAITGMLVAGLALLGVAVYYYILTNIMGMSPDDRRSSTRWSPWASALR
jgi:K(+)-stimulated pyrophosphate-energized sodium pump